MKVSTKYMYDSFIDDMLEKEREVYEIRRLISSGKKLEEPSDSPQEFAEVVSLKDTLGSLENYNKNVEFAESWLKITESSINSMNDLLTRAKSLAVQTSTGTISRENRMAIANEVEQIINSLIDMANTKYQGRFIFSGFKTDTPALSSGYTPSEAIADGSNIYKGAGTVTVIDQTQVPYRANIVVEVVDSNTYRYSLDGGNTFTTEFFSSPGVAEFSGLRVELPPTEIHSGDRFYISILGGEYQGDDGEMHLKIGDSEEDKIKINLTAQELLKGEGIDVMRLMRNFHAALRANNTQEIQKTLDELDKAISLLAQASGDVGSRLNRVDTLKNFYSVKKETFTEELSSREDTDIVEATSKMAEADVFYKAILTMFAKMSKVNLLDYLA